MIILDTHVWVRWLDSEAAPLPSWMIDKIESADTRWSRLAERGLSSKSSRHNLQRLLKNGV